jgi:hypothetical protein
MVFLTTPAGNATATPASTIAGNWPAIGTLAGSNNCAYGDGLDSDYSSLSDQVFRMEVIFLLKDGTLSTRPILSPYNSSASDPTASNGLPTYKVGSRWFNASTRQGFICRSAVAGAATWDRIGTQDVLAIVIAMALLDPASRKLFPASAYAGMANALPDPSQTDLDSKQLMAQVWQPILNDASYAADCRHSSKSRRPNPRLPALFFPQQLI